MREIEREFFGRCENNREEPGGDGRMGRWGVHDRLCLSCASFMSRVRSLSLSLSLALSLAFSLAGFLPFLEKHMRAVLASMQDCLKSWYRCRANMEHIRPDSGLGFQVEVLKTFSDISSSLGSGWGDLSSVSSYLGSLSNTFGQIIRYKQTPKHHTQQFNEEPG